ncbi:unnamed protein product [Microthlaspi erraticum]|uniref:Reverse transcriptase domain-containing protein n=1 Tax=Microthlaspi erraticum TaxID=1685480 RepID=A0A6D2HIU0_9BRAS|nr:unnamed protein product [Microthlaspi erraticum]
MQNSKELINDCGLVEFLSRANTLSWRGRRRGKIVRCRLDRALATEEWHDLFSFSHVEYLKMIGSDHRPILATLDSKVTKRRQQFRFDKRWIGREGLLESIEKGWKNFHGEVSPSLVDRIHSCRHEISVWRKNNQPYGKARIAELQTVLEVVQDDDTKTQEELIDITNKLKEAYRDEEGYWKQKSRNMWLKDGDLNTKFFHASTKQRRAVNRIVGLHNEGNVWVAGEKEVQRVAVDYFQKLFTSTLPVDFTRVLENVSGCITPTENEILTRCATEMEVREALFMMHPEKAPGPDGMTALFFQRSWHVVKGDILPMVNNFLATGVLEDILNMTNICLIPKTDRPTRMTELRPISLCNVGYKIISKVLCQRLKGLLPRLISETQSAFVPGRLISDNILIAQEMFNGLRTNKACRGKFMAVKTDMSKAYDRVEWPFIEALMRKMGFAEAWITWMMSCIKSVKYRVLINGQPRGKIIPQRGLRQGDPLSPYLFIMCTEILITNLKKAEVLKEITGLKVARASPAVSHLLFADDSLFFCKAITKESRVLLQILKEYEIASGQQINFAKSSVQFGHTVDEGLRAEIHQILGITNVGGMDNYLGIPESLGAKTKIFSFLIDRQYKRVNGWNSKWLSRGGKEVLIKSVLSAMPTHVMSCFRLPKGVTNKLTSAVSNFWWSNNGQTRGMHWLAWKKLCRHKNAGGLGFRVIEDFNTALLAKKLWRLLDNPDSLFSQVFKGRYYRNSDPLEPIRSYSPSYGWQSMVSARPLVNKGLIKRVGSGNSISVLLARGQPQDTGLISTLIFGEDVPIILGIPTSRTGRPDSMGWFFTKSGRYTVKSGYVLAQQSLDEANPIKYGPDISPLQAYTWKVKCTQKLQHFIWQVLTGCVSVGTRLQSRGLQIDPQCVRCALDHFPTGGLFTNIAHLFWNLPNDERMGMYPWLLWFIWKARNDKVFSNDDSDPNDIINHAASEAVAWRTAQARQEVTPVWRGIRLRSRQSACYGRRKLTIVFETDCSDVVKMVSKPEEWPAFAPILEEFCRCRMEFTSFSIVHIPRTKNTKADKLARSARVLPTDVFYVNSVSPTWIPELV